MEWATRASLVAIAVTAIGSRAAVARQASSGRDLKIENQIETNLLGDPELKDDTIDVRVENNVATLKGSVDTDSERLKAERLAHVEGVVRVEDQLKVADHRPKRGTEDDAVTTTKILGLYRGDPSLKYSDISVDTHGGVAVLTGTVLSNDARRQAVDIARNTSGVRRVEDHLHVAGPSEPMPR